MIDEEVKKRIIALCNKPVALGGWLGLPYEQDGCLKFAVKFYREMGIEATEEALKEARNFVKVTDPEFGDIVVFQNAPFAQYHIGVMLDRFKAIQCGEVGLTNGVGKIRVGEYPFIIDLVKGFYRHRSCF